MNLIEILEKTTSPDQNELQQAQMFLEQAAQQNITELLKSLSDVLNNGLNSAVARMQAGLQLKNALYSKDQTIKVEYQQRWLMFPENVRLHVKKNVLETLGTETFRPSTAAQCVANIACTELPQGLWPDLIVTLCRNVVGAGSKEMMKESSLEAMGYICQDIEPEILQTQSNEILTAIVHGMKKEEQSNNVRFAATNALLNSLEFTKGNFDKDSERHFIMQVVCEATQSQDTHVKVAALQCLVKIMSLYYMYMETYMGPALFAITMEAMKDDVDEVSLQGIEFWSTVCDKEVDLAIELSEAAEAGRPPERTSSFYAKGALQYLVPVLLVSLTKQEEFDDDDEWNPCKAAGVCLMLLATCCEDDVIKHVLPFVRENIHNKDWRYRDAAVMAFGSILEGPDVNNLKPLVEQAIPMLIECFKDQSVIVRDTGAWTIGRVCEILPEAIISENHLPPLLLALVEGLEAEPRVASNVCWAFSSLAEAAFENADTVEDGSDPQTYCPSSYFKQIVQKLIAAADRQDGNQNNLRNAAYEAIMELMKNSPTDLPNCIENVIDIIRKVRKSSTNGDNTAQPMQQNLPTEGGIQLMELEAQMNALNPRWMSPVLQHRTWSEPGYTQVTSGPPDRINSEPVVNIGAINQPLVFPVMQPLPEMQNGQQQRVEVQAINEHQRNNRAVAADSGEQLPVYPMSKIPRGWCVIINNRDFYVNSNDNQSKEMPQRSGTDVDAQSLQHVFETLGFIVRRRDNLTDTQMIQFLIDVARNVDHTNFECFVCCILTHGVLNHLYGTNGRLVSIKGLTSMFQANRCPTLVGKPKLFFLQACQGRDKMTGGENGGNIQRDAGMETDNDKEIIPNESDFLIGYATVPGYVSFRGRTHGSWYIRKLCELLEKLSHKEDLMSILVQVNNEVSKASANLQDGVYEPTPAPLFTLRKKLYFL